MDERHPEEIAQLFGCHRTTVDRIVKKYNSEGRVESKPRGGCRPRALEVVHERAIQSYVADNCSITLKKMKERLVEDFNINVGKSSIDRSLSSFSFTLKRVSLVPERRNDENNMETRYIYAREFFSLLPSEDGNNIFFLDEVGFNVSMRSGRGRSLIGYDAVQIVPGLRNRNISVCCLMSKNGTFHYKKQTHPFNRESFSEFINEILNKFRELGLENRIIVMDNVPFHKCIEVREKIILEGHVIKYLPPYSPFLNPIENLFSQWKQMVRSSDPNNEALLFSIIDDTFQQITQNNCANYYRHMLNVLSRCVNKEPINDE
jgi:transposase